MTEKFGGQHGADFNYPADKSLEKIMPYIDDRVMSDDHTYLTYSLLSVSDGRDSGRSGAWGQIIASRNRPTIGTVDTLRKNLWIDKSEVVNGAPDEFEYKYPAYIWYWLREAV